MILVIRVYFLRLRRAIQRHLSLAFKGSTGKAVIGLALLFWGESMVGKGVRGGSRKGMRKRKGWFSDGLFENI